MKKLLDIPPVWLFAALVIAWVQSRYFDYGLDFGETNGLMWADFAGGLLIGGGLILMGLAVVEFRRHKTTIIPGQEASHMITSGIFKRSRNPIYLGDFLLLLGAILTWDAVLALPLFPLFIWLLEKRFVIPEENALRRKFRAEFARYCEKTRRWL